MSTAGNHFPIIGNGNGMGTKKHLLGATSVSVRYTFEVRNEELGTEK
ncbi:hypothetical protein GGD38_001150 [Chitinophagaceae bacterium OAS944]|nr:hypothetical protein [Chitinophagaceae bacterium OAS944]